MYEFTPEEEFKSLMDMILGLCEACGEKFCEGKGVRLQMMAEVESGKRKIDGVLINTLFKVLFFESMLLEHKIDVLSVTSKILKEKHPKIYEAITAGRKSMVTEYEDVIFVLKLE